MVLKSRILVGAEFRPDEVGATTVGLIEVQFLRAKISSPIESVRPASLR